MYNKYIGNTGKFIRVEEPIRENPSTVARPAAKPPPAAVAQAHDVAPPPVKNKSLFGGLGSLGGLGGLGRLGGLGGLGRLGGLNNLTGSFKGLFDHLPFGLDIGDILLFLLLFFFFIESGDEEFIIILAVIGYSMFKER